MILIGLSGKLGSGKNYVAEKIIPELLPKLLPERALQMFQLAFGDQLKVELAVRNQSLTFETLFQQKSRESRQLMQEYGTDLCRKQLGPDVWIRSMDIWMQVHRMRIQKGIDPVFIISDVRFRNEALWIQEKGGILLRLEAPDRNQERLLDECVSEEAATHASETDLDTFPFQHILNNRKNVTEDNLRAQVYRVLQKVLQG